MKSLIIRFTCFVKLIDVRREKKNIDSLDLTQKVNLSELGLRTKVVDKNESQGCN